MASRPRRWDLLFAAYGDRKKEVAPENSGATSRPPHSLAHALGIKATRTGGIAGNGHWLWELPAAD